MAFQTDFELEISQFADGSCTTMHHWVFISPLELGA